MARDKYIQFRVSSEQKANIQANASRNNQTVTDYIMTAIMEYERINLERYGQPYDYGCLYQFARDYLIKLYSFGLISGQGAWLAIKYLEERIQELKEVKSE